MKLMLPDDIYSHQDLKQLINELKNYVAWFRKMAIKARVGQPVETESPTLSNAAQQFIDELDQNAQNNDQLLDELITILKRFEMEAPTITITLAAPADNDLKSKLVAWCRQNLDPKILVEFHYRSNIFGGMVVKYGSQIFDWSFHRQIMANVSHFPEVLRRV